MRPTEVTRLFTTCTIAVLTLSASPAWAVCVLDSRITPSLSTEAFLETPARMLDWYKGREFAWTGEVAVLSTRPAALPGFPAFMRTANPEQRRAIGQALGRTARKCRSRDADLVRKVSDIVTRSGVREVMLAFQAASDDDQGSLGIGALPPAATPGRSSTPLANVGGSGVSAGSQSVRLRNPLELPLDGILRTK